MFLLEIFESSGSENSEMGSYLKKFTKMPSKKAAELNLPYRVLSFGETPKKIKEILDAVKNLFSIEKIE